MRSAFLTRRYKSGWIHSCYDAALNREVITVQLRDYTVRDANSPRSAKILITRSEKQP